MSCSYLVFDSRILQAQDPGCEPSEHQAEPQETAGGQTAELGEMVSIFDQFYQPTRGAAGGLTPELGKEYIFLK